MTKKTLSTYEVTYQTLYAAGLGTHRSRDLMSMLTLLRIGGATYEATVREQTITIEIYGEDMLMDLAMGNRKRFAWLTIDDADYRLGKPVSRGQAGGEDLYKVIYEISIPHDDGAGSS